MSLFPLENSPSPSLATRNPARRPLFDVLRTPPSVEREKPGRSAIRTNRASRSGLAGDHGGEMVRLVGPGDRWKGSHRRSRPGTGQLAVGVSSVDAVGDPDRGRAAMPVSGVSEVGLVVSAGVKRRVPGVAVDVPLSVSPLTRGVAFDVLRHRAVRSACVERYVIRRVGGMAPDGSRGDCWERQEGANGVGDDHYLTHGWFCPLSATQEPFLGL